MEEQTPKKKYKYLSLDLWGTLIKGNPEHSKLRNELIHKIIFPEFGVTHTAEMLKKAKTFADYSNEALGQQMTWQQSILCVAFQYPEFTRKNLILERFKQYQKAYEKLALEHIPLIYSNDTWNVLNELANKKVPMIFASNTSFTPGYLMREVLHKMELTVFTEVMMFSDEIGFSKPSSDFFEEVALIFDANVEDILHVGDNPFADGGSKSSGIDFLHINGDSGKTIKELLNYF